MSSLQQDPKVTISKFISSIIGLFVKSNNSSSSSGGDNLARQNVKNLSEVFRLFLDYARLGEPEVKFLVESNIVNVLVEFYLSSTSTGQDILVSSYLRTTCFRHSYLKTTCLENLYSKNLIYSKILIYT